jgi:Photosynthetic reaction centre cytochrome C subunit
MRASLLLLLALVAAAASAQPVADKPADKPMEETKKNIKVLRGVPSSQLIPIMTVMANSLGVTCAYCHEQAWESDAKPPKEAGRRMVRLVRAVNEQYYGGRAVVTCNSCHRGRVETEPVPDIVDAGWNKPHPPSRVDPPLPSAEEMFARYIRAWGAPEAVAAVRNRRSLGIATGQSGRGDPRSAPFEMFQELPATIDIKADLSYPPEANREFASQFFNAMKIRDRYAEVKTVAVERIRGRDTYVVEARPKEGATTERLWFDSASGLLLRRQIDTPTLIGPLPQAYDFDDYRSIDGVMVPFVLQWSRGDYQITFRFAEVRHNAPRQVGPPPGPS